MASVTGQPRPLSPNQLEKRRQIIETAKAVLLRDGLEACTARTLAGEKSFSRSALHYYFASVEEVVDAAMASQLEAFVEDLRAVAKGHDDPVERFWAVAERYLTAFDEQPGLALLWWDYSIASIHAGRREPVLRVEAALHEVLGELLRDCGIADWQARSEALLAYMIGTTMRRILHPAPFETIRPELASLSGLPISS